MNMFKNKVETARIKNIVVKIPNIHIKYFYLYLLFIIHKELLSYYIAKSLRMMNLCFSDYI